MKIYNNLRLKSMSYLNEDIMTLFDAIDWQKHSNQRKD